MPPTPTPSAPSSPVHKRRRTAPSDFALQAPTSPASTLHNAVRAALAQESSPTKRSSRLKQVYDRFRLRAIDAARNKAAINATGIANVNNDSNNDAHVQYPQHNESNSTTLVVLPQMINSPQQSTSPTNDSATAPATSRAASGDSHTATTTTTIISTSTSTTNTTTVAAATTARTTPTIEPPRPSPPPAPPPPSHSSSSSAPTGTRLPIAAQARSQPSCCRPPSCCPQNSHNQHQNTRSHHHHHQHNSHSSHTHSDTTPAPSPAPSPALTSTPPPPDSASPGIFPGKGARAGCEHYQRSCWIKAACCNKYYACRRCHDEAETHEIDRRATELVACVHCGDADQPVSSNCRTCNVKFARYFCAECKFYDDRPGHDAYHCDGCGICRVGKGLGIDNYHCDRCGNCVPINAKDTHPCRERSLDSNCPICTEYLATSTEQVVFLACGHCMHVECLNQHTKSRFYTCPICHKAITDMSDWYKALDIRLAQDVMPPEYQNRMSTILCHDCDVKNDVPFHFIYHKCPRCRGYNTRVLANFDKPPENTSIASATTTATTDVNVNVNVNNVVIGNATASGGLAAD